MVQISMASLRGGVAGCALHKKPQPSFGPTREKCEQVPQQTRKSGALLVVAMLLTTGTAPHE